MGIGFVIFIHLIAILILGVIISIIVGTLTYFICDKEKKKQKVFAAILSPFFGVYTFYFVGLFGSIVISEIKNVDIGIGDSFYVPLIDNYELRFNDTPEYAYIENNGLQIIHGISKIQQIDYQIFGKINNDEFFSYDIKRKELKEFKSEIGLSDSSNKKLELIEIREFYAERKREVIGVSLTIVGVISLIASVIVIYMLKILVVGYMNFR